MKTRTRQPRQKSDPIGPNGELGEGCYELNNGRGKYMVCVQNGVLHVPIGWLGKLEALVMGYKIILSNNHAFVSAADVAVCRPNLKVDMERVARVTKTRLYPLTVLA